MARRLFNDVLFHILMNFHHWPTVFCPDVTDTVTAEQAEHLASTECDVRRRWRGVENVSILGKQLASLVHLQMLQRYRFKLEIPLYLCTVQKHQSLPRALRNIICRFGHVFLQQINDNYPSWFPPIMGPESWQHSLLHLIFSRLRMAPVFSLYLAWSDLPMSGNSNKTCSLFL